MTDINLSGMLLVDKPAGSTSTFIVRKIKNLFRGSRIGHLGTLDPFATGLLPIMVGSTTRLASELMDYDKEYSFTIQLGVETDTLDPTGNIVATKHVSAFSLETISSILQKFTGTIEQIPPVYSAIKMKGRPLYEYMRTSGSIPFDIETKTRIVTIKSCVLEGFDETKQTINLRVLCSKGTYIRSLARDIAHALNTVGICATLRRTKIGSWDVSNAFKIEENQNINHFEQIKNKIIPPEKLLPSISKLLFPEKFLKFLNSGNVFYCNREGNENVFDTLKSTIQTGENFFTGIINHDEILFLSNCSLVSSEQIVCKPKKKII